LYRLDANLLYLFSLVLSMDIVLIPFPMARRTGCTEHRTGVATSLAGAALRFAPIFWERFSADLKRPVLTAPHHPRFQHWTNEGLYAAWIGHSTVVIRIDGFTIVTDPVFSDRIGLNLGPFTLGLKRLVAAAVGAGETPGADLILLSHAHMDHFDLPSLHTLESKRTSVVTAVKTSDLLRPGRYQTVKELRWNEVAQIGPITVRAFEVNHWGARMQTDTYRGYNGYVIESGRYRVLFGGDSAWTDTFRPLRALGKIDLAIMPIGAYNPWIRAHCNPEQALKMANDAGAGLILPVHHQTFELSSEPLGEPIERLLAAAGEDRICLREIGQEFHR
jgi:L-ascorbate metabolism protein UlaG (beta-lactamase superfamily)